ncbi:hypothetical protein [Xenorhabdus japonica]|uniref:Fimbrial protein n=1 Tax=Xenorhabdus japonica TaxID=53341 RepID=A0A1I5EDR0_9GAMM|nr:hypothetical protein [Xenorhabdus japonica]SFO09642.1 hypothetical protein SAMN05421579_1653 [Xenorhabdus japonica]
MNNKILLLFFGLLMLNPIYGLCKAGYFILTGSLKATGKYSGETTGYNSIMVIEINLPPKIKAVTKWIYPNCSSSDEVEAISIINLRKEIELTIAGKKIKAIGMLQENEVKLTYPIAHSNSNLGNFVSFWGKPTAPYLADCGIDGEDNGSPYPNDFKGINIVTYRIEGDIPVGNWTGTVDIGRVNAYRETPPINDSNLKKYGLTLNTGAILNMDYEINIINSCRTTPFGLIELKHPDLTTTNFDGNIVKRNINIQCDKLADITLSLTSSSSSGKKTEKGNKIELPLSTDKSGVNSILSVEGNNLMYDPNKNKSIVKVGPDGETLQISSMLKKTANNITTGEYSTNAILTIAFD